MRDNPRRLHLSPYNAHYFVDPTNGSDTNAGTTPDAPIKTVQPLIGVDLSSDYRWIALKLSDGWHWMDTFKCPTTAGPVAGNFTCTLTGATVQWLYGDGTYGVTNAPNKSYSDNSTKTVIGFCVSAGGTSLTLNNCNYVSFSLADLPAGLTALSCFGDPLITGSFAYLPDGLTSLSCYTSTLITGNIADLPHGLTLLNCSNDLLITGNLADLPTGLTYLYCYSDPLITGPVVSRPYINFDTHNCSALTTYTAGAFSTQKSLTPVNLTNCNLPQAAIDNILADLVTSLSISGRVTCVVSLGGTNAAPSSAGYASKSTLVSAGWTVTTN
jgi:hypothetical protein